LFSKGLENYKYEKLNLPKEINLDKRIMRAFRKVYNIDKLAKLKKIIKEVVTEKYFKLFKNILNN